jgi:hypothetical protein
VLAVFFGASIALILTRLSLTAFSLISSQQFVYFHHLRLIHHAVAEVHAVVRIRPFTGLRGFADIYPLSLAALTFVSQKRADAAYIIQGVSHRI